MRKSLIITLSAGFCCAAALALAAGVTHIDQVNKTFSQTSVTIAVGDTLSFENHDDVTHNITVVDSDDNADDLGLQKPGETIQHQFTTPGEYVARCQIHPKMKMTVTVK